MHSFCYPSGTSALAIVLGFLSVLVIPLAAQETVHQFLERQNPGQTKGAPTASVIIEEFSDFQCAYCGKFARDTLPRVARAYIDTGKVRLIFRHFAILGPASTVAAEASACAGAQNQFWSYHDRLFAAQGRLPFTRDTFRSFAEELSLNLADFTECLDSRHFKTQVQKETTTATALGFQGTPGFIINGQALVGALPFEIFQTVIEEALATVASGIPATPPADKSASEPPVR